MSAQSSQQAPASPAPRSIGPAVFQEALGDICHELRRTLVEGAMAVDLLDAGVLTPCEYDRLLQQLQRRADYALAIIARTARLGEFGPSLEAALRPAAPAVRFVPLREHLHHVGDRLQGPLAVSILSAMQLSPGMV